MPDNVHPHLQPTVDPSEAVEPPPTIDATGNISTFDRERTSHAPEGAAPTVPGYAITGELARGGMGVVYAAIDQTLEREVAIKTLLPGATADRFVTESKITARLPHPGIPPVHALGRLDDGSPYLVMKLIRGRTLADLLKERSSPSNDISKFVAIFEQIAQAVGFAHEQGIIHRDLKPLNVMVGAFGEVQVMDWGLAKDLASREHERAESDASIDILSHTTAGAIMGTPGYMAPEQARGEPVDTRADVFALGAILAAILTGKPAFVGTTVLETIQKSADADLGDVIARLHCCGADPDLVALAQMCLAAQPDQRAADARAVAKSVAAYRAGVEARLRRAETEAAEAAVRDAEQRKRRRALCGAALVVTLAMAVGLSVSLWQRNVAVAAELRAVADRNAKGEALKAEQAALGKEKAATEQALKRLAQVEKGNEILTAIFKDLDVYAVKQSNEPLEAVLAKRLVKAVEQLEGDAVGDPLVVAGLQYSVGHSLRNLGFAREASAVLEKALNTRKARLGPDHPDTLAVLSKLGGVLVDARQLDRALPILDEVHSALKAQLGPDHPDTLKSMVNLADGLRYAGKLNRALPLLEEALKISKVKLGPDHQETLTVMSNLAGVFVEDGKIDCALPLYEEAHRCLKARLGDDHPDTLASMSTLANGLKAAGKLDQALPLFEDAHRRLKARLGSEHPERLAALNNLAQAFKAAGSLDRALLLYEEAHRLLKARLGPDHSDALTATTNFAQTLKDVGDLDRALPLFEEAAMGVAKRRFQHEHAGTIVTNLATAYQTVNQFGKAERWHREWAAIVKERAGSASPAYASALVFLGGNLTAQGRWAEAEAVLRECLAVRERAQPDNVVTFNTRSVLGGALLGQKKYSDAAPLLLGGYQGMKKRQQTIPPPFKNKLMGEALDRLIDLYTVTNKPDEVKKWKAERAKFPSTPAAMK